MNCSLSFGAKKINSYNTWNNYLLYRKLYNFFKIIVIEKQRQGIADSGSVKSYRFRLQIFDIIYLKLVASKN